MNESNLRARIKNSIRRPKKIFEHSLVNGYLDSTSLNSQERVSLFSNNFQPSMDNETMCSLKQKLHILNKQCEAMHLIVCQCYVREHELIRKVDLLESQLAVSKIRELELEHKLSFSQKGDQTVGYNLITVSENIIERLLIPRCQSGLAKLPSYCSLSARLQCQNLKSQRPQIMCNLHHNYSHAGRPAFITTRTHGRRSSNNGLNTLGQKIVDQSWKRQVQGGNEHNLRTMGNGVISANKNKQVMTKEATSFSRVDLDRSKLLPRLYEQLKWSLLQDKADGMQQYPEGCHYLNCFDYRSITAEGVSILSKIRTVLEDISPIKQDSSRELDILEAFLNDQFAIKILQIILFNYPARGFSLPRQLILETVHPGGQSSVLPASSLHSRMRMEGIFSRKFHKQSKQDLA